MLRIETPFEVNPVLFGPHSAATYGDGTVDVVVAERGTGKLYHTRFLPDRNRPPINPVTGLALLPFQPLDVAAADRPVLTASGHKRFHLIVPTVDGLSLAGSMHTKVVGARLPRRATRLTAGGSARVGTVQSVWSPFVPMNPGPSHIASAARLGDAELATVVSVKRGRLVVRRYNGLRWMAAEPVFGQLAPVSPNRPNRVVVSPLWLGGQQ